MVHLRPRVLNLKTSLRLAELTHRCVIAVLIIKGQRFCEYSPQAFEVRRASLLNLLKNGCHLA